MPVTDNNVSLQGKPNDLVARMKSKDFFKPIWGELDNMLKAELYTGRSAEIVDKYCGPGPLLYTAARSRPVSVHFAMVSS